MVGYIKPSEDSKLKLLPYAKTSKQQGKWLMQQTSRDKSQYAEYSAHILGETKNSYYIQRIGGPALWLSKRMMFDRNVNSNIISFTMKRSQAKRKGLK